MVPEIMSEISKKLSNNCFNVNFHHQGGANPKVMGTVESSSSRCFFGHLAKSNWTNSYGYTNCWENSRAAAVAAAGGGAAGLQYDYEVLICAGVCGGELYKQFACVGEIQKIYRL